METVHYNNIPDLHAPKFIAKRFNLLNERKHREFFDNMKKKYPQLMKYTNVEISAYVEVFNRRISQEVVTNRNGVRLPEGLGIIIAGACKVSKKTADKKIDYGTSMKLGYPVPYLNLHSDGYVAKVKYSNFDNFIDGGFENNNMWAFRACRALERGVSAEFKKGNHKNYVVLNTYHHISTLFREPKIKKDVAGERRDDKLKKYDEFAFE